VVARTVRAVRLVARDGRIPRPLRWLGALALLPVPGPFDEAVLLLVGVLLFAFYRAPLREAWSAACFGYAPRSMAETARQFFEGLEGRIDPVRTAGETVSYRFDVGGGGSWHVDVDDGRVTVTESRDEADCVVEVSEETFLRIVRGEQNPTTAFMTGKLKVKGDMAHALKLQKLFA
jgi:hypothetical protein